MSGSNFVKHVFSYFKDYILTLIINELLICATDLYDQIKWAQWHYMITVDLYDQIKWALNGIYPLEDILLSCSIYRYLPN